MTPHQPLPDRIGPYPVHGELGRGGMGVVYEAEDPKLERRIAVKVLPRERTRDATWLARFEREARILAAINHPNITMIHTLEEDEGLHYITMELVEGDTLADLIAWQPLSIKETLRLSRQIASGLEAAHKQGIVHRDLKPNNVRVTSDGLVKILDFGLAKSVRDTERLAAAGKVYGTPGYMGPEQLHGSTVDHRADQWAFGCVMYECLTGQQAFRGESLTELVVATLEQDPDWDALPEDTPRRLRDLLANCLAKDVDHRLGMIRLARQEIEEEIAQEMLPAWSSTRAAEEGSRPGNLPRQLSTFVGRERQLEDVGQMLSDHRLVTLTGVGGCGKSRLAVEVAQTLLDATPDGVWLVELAPLADGALVTPTTATVLGVQEEPNRPLIEGLTRFLTGKNLLLVVDNCEHVLSACAQLIDALLQSVAGLRVIATSREVLGIAGETIYQVPPLGLPEASVPISVDAIDGIEAVRLFVERGTAVHPDFALTESNAPAVVEICRRLDGIPLALELAAARVKVMSVHDIAQRLDDRFRLLTAGTRTALPHHQTLQALVDWSYDHLTANEQALLRCLSVHAGGWTLDAAEHGCCGDGIEDWQILDLLAHLVDKSLVELDAGGVERGGRTRYRMLETVRQYAAERLRESGDEATARSRHRDFVLGLAERAEPYLTGPDQGQWLSRLDAEHGNVRVALDWCAETDAEAESGLRMAAALGRYWFIRGHWSEGRSFLTRLIARSDADIQTLSRSKAIKCAGNLAYVQGELVEARALYEESLAGYRELEDREGIADCLSNLGNTAVWQADYAEARAFYEESLTIRRQLGDHWGIAASLNNLGNLAYMQGDFARARASYEESLTISRDLGDRTGDTLRLINLGIVARKQGEHAEAHAFLVRSLTLARELENTFCTALSLEAMGILAVSKGEHVRAARLLGAADALREDISAPLSPAEREEIDRDLSTVRDLLGNEAFEQAWTEGRDLACEQAVELAMQLEGS